MSEKVSIETSLAKEALFVAKTQIDIREEGNNGGPEVKRYLKAVGLSVGYPWCMAFVYWCVDQAAQKLQLANPLIITGGVLRQWNESNLRKVPAKASGPVQPGDIFIMDFGGGIGHTGFVVSINGSIVNTIEGNTNNDGSREGYEVAYKQRSLSAIKGFILLP